MLDLKKVNLPDTVEVEGRFYYIKTDFRDWLRFSEILESNTKDVTEFNFLYIGSTPPDLIKGFEALLEFYSPKIELPRPSHNKKSNEKLLDYNVDAALIYAAFYEVYKIDLMATDKNGHAIKLHWHKFLTLLQGLHGTRLNEIMSYRAYDSNDKSDYKKQMQELHDMWHIETIQDKKAKERLEHFSSLLK